MLPQKPISIVGGGLAGLTLGIGLRQRNVPVTIVEAGKYPRHRVCGEFISGRGVEILKRLGLRELFFDAGAIEATTAILFSAKKAAPIKNLPESAICLSRFEMDALLAKRFLEIGGELRENERWQKNDPEENVVMATGRELHPAENGWRWFGLKVHARGVDLLADLEMHISRNGYVGLCKLRNGVVNVCGLFRRRAGEDLQERGMDLLRGQSGSLLRARLEHAEFAKDSFCAVAGLSLHPHRAAPRTECRIGDAITMIPPVTGNGMSMAFESAEAAIEPLIAFSAGKISWPDAQQAIAHRCDTMFVGRLFWSCWLQRLMLAPTFQTAFMQTFARSDWFWQGVFKRTR